MKVLLKVFVLALCMSFYNCSSDDSNQGQGTGGGQLNLTAQYRATFTPDFTEEDYPTDYPQNIMFSKMVIITHGSTKKLFRENTNATSGFEVYVETGETDNLVSEYQNVDEGEVAVGISIGQDITPGNISTVEFTVSADNPMMSFASRLSPSPDWFVGLDSFSLVNPDNTLVEERTFTLSFYDGGTDSGATYTSADEDSFQPITIINGAPFINPGTGLVSKLGTLTIERIDNGNQ